MTIQEGCPIPKIRNIFSLKIGAYPVFDGLISSFGRVNSQSFQNSGVLLTYTTADV